MLTARDSVEDRVAGLDVRRRRLPDPSHSRSPSSSPDYVRSCGAVRSTADDPRMSATCASTRDAQRSGAETTGIDLDRQGIRVARGVHAPVRAENALRATTCSNKPGTIAYDNRSNVIAVYVNYLRDKIDRPFGARARSRRSGEPATGCERKTDHESRADPDAVDPSPSHWRWRWSLNATGLFLYVRLGSALDRTRSTRA